MATERSWAEFETNASDLAATGTHLLYRGTDTAAAYLATTAPDGGPRLHPVFPVLHGGELWLFIVNLSPKYRDLVRNGWYALHSLPTEAGGEEFFVRGHAAEVTDPSVRERVVAATGGLQGGHEFEALFRCAVARILYTRWEGWGTAQTRPAYTKWPERV